MFSKIVVAFFAVMAVAFAAPAAKPDVWAYNTPVSAYSAYAAPLSTAYSGYPLHSAYSAAYASPLHSAYSAYGAPIHSAYAAHPLAYSAGYSGLPVAGYSGWSAHAPAVYY